MYNQQAIIRKERNNKGEMRVIRVEIVEFRCASSQVDLVSKDQVIMTSGMIFYFYTIIRYAWLHLTDIE